MDDEKEKTFIERVEELREKLGLTEAEAAQCLTNFIGFMSMSEKQADFQMELIRIFDEVYR